LARHLISLIGGTCCLLPVKHSGIGGLSEKKISVKRSSAQAQAQLEAELALFSFDPAPHPPVKVYLAANINKVVTKLQCWAY
jgi:hypothetical protein